MKFPRTLLFLAFAIPTQAANIEDLYEKNCASCHGGKSTPPGMGGSLFLGTWKHGSTDDVLTKHIHDGIPELGMPAWGKVLTSEEIRAMVVFLREQTGKKQNDKVAQSPIQQEISTQKAKFTIQPLTTFPSEPWAITPLPMGGFLATLKEGKLLLLDADGKIVREIPDIPASAVIGQGGMLDVALSPNFQRDGWIYLTFTDFIEKNGQKAGMTTLVRGKIVNGRWANTEKLWKSDQEFYTNSGQHFGSRIAFDKQGHVFFSVGERGRNSDRGASDITSPVGKIYRLNLDGSVPLDNPKLKTPVVGIFSYGHRNQQGLAINPRDGKLYNSEHGPRGGDEINLVQSGHNYGWPDVTYGINYDGSPWGKGETSRPGVTQPIHYWTPSIGVSAIDFYQGNTFPGWKNDLLVASLVGQKFIRLHVENEVVTEKETLITGIGRWRDWCQDRSGAIFLLSNRPNQLFKLVPAP